MKASVGRVRLGFSALVACASLLLLAACATPPPVVPTDYKGQDAGHVVIGVGAANGTLNEGYSFRVRSADGAFVEPKSWGNARFVYYQSNLFRSRTPDYKNASEAGVVIVSTMPPGKYEIFNFDVFFNGYPVSSNYSSRTAFSIPFTVEAGKTVYLGNYQANALKGENLLGITVAAGAVFVVEDRLETDMVLAKKQAQELPEATVNAVPSVQKINNPYFVAKRLSP
jgi:hypothetical protein